MAGGADGTWPARDLQAAPRPATAPDQGDCEGRATEGTPAATRATKSVVPSDKPWLIGRPVKATPAPELPPAAAVAPPPLPLSIRRCSPKSCGALVTPSTAAAGTKPRGCKPYMDAILLVDMAAGTAKLPLAVPSEGVPEMCSDPFWGFRLSYVSGF